MHDSNAMEGTHGHLGIRMEGRMYRDNWVGA